MFVTLKDIYTITGQLTKCHDIINKLRDKLLSWYTTLNLTLTSYNHPYDDVTKNKKLSLKDDHKYFMWSFLGKFIFRLSGTKPIINLFPIVVAMFTGKPFAPAQILLGNFYNAMRKKVFKKPFRKSVGSARLCNFSYFYTFWLLGPLFLT